HFNAAEFNDRYEDAVVELIRSKQAGLPAKPTEQPRPSNVVNILDALRKSIAAVGGAEPTPTKRDAKPVEATPAASRPKAPSKTRGEVEPVKDLPMAAASRTRKSK
ncbi:MAG TPA: hypothetical protein VEH77_15120, partial [Roseiarcus sp.]|nr:hypothetical protein [Roseiarcus sp.]